MDNYVITVGREYGSAGRQIAMQLAKELGIKEIFLYSQLIFDFQ